MPEDGGGQAPRRTPSWMPMAVFLLLLVVWTMLHGGGDGSSATAGGQSAATVSGRPAAIYAAHTPLPSVRPVRLDIPSIGLHAKVIERGLVDGAVDPPPYETPGVAGWYGGGPMPGDAGAALLVGHVDTPTGPAVFYGLSSVLPGSLVEVTREDGSIAEFTVEAVQVIEKSEFTVERVYGAGTRPEMRLITCGGTFDSSRHVYTANVVVYTALTGSRSALGQSAS